MSNKRFIDIYSGNRNRNQWPLVSEFEVPVSFTRTLTTTNQALDPIYSGAIIFQWSATGKIADVDGVVDYGPAQPGTTLASIIIDPLSANSPSQEEIGGNPIPPNSNFSQPTVKNFYTGYYIQFENDFTNPDGSVQTRRIVSYEPSTCTLTLEFPFGGDPANLVGNTYIIYDSSDGVSLSSEYLYVHLPMIDDIGVYARDYANAYNGYYMMDETLSYGLTIVGRLITQYDYLTRFCYLDSPFPPGWKPGDSYSIRQQLPLEKWKLTDATNTNVYPIIITLPNEPGVNTNNNYYVGKYVYFASNTKQTKGVQTGVYGNYYITKYDAATRQLYVLPDVDSIPEGYPSIGDTINIVSFIKDNFNPLDYYGTMVGVNDSVCYDITLSQLQLPNRILKTGSKIAFYPFVYVTLSNTTAPSTAGKELMYSNNPNSVGAVFSASISDITQPEVSTFIKMDGASMSPQTIKFKPNDNLYFKIYFADGRLFEPDANDTRSPYEPDPTLQVHAIFAIKKI